jgi:hypothetical protein
VPFVVFYVALLGACLLLALFQWPALYDVFALLFQPMAFRGALIGLACANAVCVILFEQLLVNTGALHAVWRRIKRACVTRVPKRRRMLLEALGPQVQSA